MKSPEPWPTAPRERAIVESLRRIIRAVDLHSRHLKATHGLTAPQLATLQALHELGRTPIGALARAVHLSAGTMTGIVRKLEQRDLLARTPSRTDRRSTELSLTPAGEALLAAAPSLLQDRFRDQLANLEDWEQQMLLASLQRIAGMMNASELDASPHLVVGEVAPEPAAAPPFPTPLTEPAPEE